MGQLQLNLSFHFGLMMLVDDVEEIKVDDEIELEMSLSIKNFQEEHLVKEKIKIK